MDTAILAKRVLHDLELEFDGDLKIGAFENNSRYVDSVSKTIDELLDEHEGCNCDCSVCALAEHA